MKNGSPVTGLILIGSVASDLSSNLVMRACSRTQNIMFQQVLDQRRPTTPVLRQAFGAIGKQIGAPLRLIR